MGRSSESLERQHAPFTVAVMSRNAQDVPQETPSNPAVCHKEDVAELLRPDSWRILLLPFYIMPNITSMLCHR